MDRGNHKKLKLCSEYMNSFSISKTGALHSNYGNKEVRTPSKDTNHCNPFALSDLLERLSDGKYGSATREYESLRALNLQVMSNLSALRCMHSSSNFNPALQSSKSNSVSSPVHARGFSDHPSEGIVASNCQNFTKAAAVGNIAMPSKMPNVTSSSQDISLANGKGENKTPVIVIDSDEEDAAHRDETQCLSNSGRDCSDERFWQKVPRTVIHEDQVKPSFNGSSYDQLLCRALGPASINHNGAGGVVWQPSIQYEKVDLSNGAQNNSFSDLVDQNQNCGENGFLPLKLGSKPRPQNRKHSSQVSKSHFNPGENNERRDAIHDPTANVNEEFYTREGADSDGDLQPESPTFESHIPSDSEESQNDGLEDLWKEMSFAMECSKNVTLDVPPAIKRDEGDEECDHSSYVLKDDLGLVCRICGIIQKSIEKIIDYQWTKGSRTTRTYFSESRNSIDGMISFSGPKLPQHDLLAAGISIHPRHEKQMKPHQLEGFSFLVRNLVNVNPGGCILAHAPGSGKTFMLISFIQSFQARDEFARPLIILPKGILSTWKREFQKWQVEEIPLYDFYSVKADNRYQQLDVLKCWHEKRSILFLGYKQFANIVCDGITSNAAAACQEMLLSIPTLLIIDEGHTPRNDNTDVLYSLSRVHTPRKVVLSGTLFQNHVREVFNILNLVRPKFLKMDSSRAVVRRILSRVHISGQRRQCRADANTSFYELVEETLQNDKDDNFKRKVTVIQDLREMTQNVLHYYKGDFLEELPGLVDFSVLLKLSGKQKAVISKLGKLDKFRRASLCSAIYIHPNLHEISENSGGDKGCVLPEEKIDSIIERLDVNDGVKTKFFLNILSLSVSAQEKLLVFSQYLLPLKFLERLIARTRGWSPGKEMFMISGDSSPEHREWSMEQFNTSPDSKIFFGSIKACGEGISLVGASRVIILDVHLNPSVSRQAIGRVFRPGQAKKVYVYRLVAADSAEEEDHRTSFRKELTSKMWFEWSEYSDNQNFELEAFDVQNCQDPFLEIPYVAEDVRDLYKR